jgi:electron transfer flavoprotein alpha subunit
MGEKDIVVFAEHKRDRIIDATYEIISKIYEVKNEDDKVDILLLGSAVDDSDVERLFRCGANTLLHYNDKSLSEYDLDRYTHVITEFVHHNKPGVLLFASTEIGMELAPKVAARLKTGLTAHIIDLYFDENHNLVQQVPGFGGNLLVNIICPDKRPQVVTFKSGVFEVKENGNNPKNVVSLSLPLFTAQNRIKLINSYVITESDQGEEEIFKKDIIISGGWGMKNCGDFELIEKLAEKLDTAICGTRPAYDEGWIPENRIIGQSGINVAPKIFISIGASGAMHYTTGFSGAKKVIAINKDKSAPIFEYCDLGIVADIEAFLSKLAVGRN